MDTPTDELTLHVEMGQLPPDAVVEIFFFDSATHDLVGFSKYAYASHIAHFGVWRDHAVERWGQLDKAGLDQNWGCFCGMDKCYEYAPRGTKPLTEVPDA